MKNEIKNLELLKVIVDSTISLPDTIEINPQVYNSVKTDVIKLDEVSTSYSYRLYRTDVSFRFLITTYKTYKTFFNKSRYLMKIEVLDNGNNRVDAITFDTKKDNSRDLQEILFKNLEERYPALLENKYNNRIDKYIIEARKYVSKNITRDQALEEILK
jgi:hypothetical protein